MSYFLPAETGVRLPVSLITGFLGSGKTALLNRLLRFPEMAHTAILINEFGDVALDQLFVQASDGEVTVLPNGCLCCDVRGDLEGAIGTLFGRRGRGDAPAFERLLIETTGLADPAPIMQMLLNQPLIVANFRLDAVVTTVDALHGVRQLREHAEAINQVLLADRLVVTKCDLADDAQVTTLVATLHSITHTSRHGRRCTIICTGSRHFH
jgi:G3E family GTPase